jgi:hypothetical protein
MRQTFKQFLVEESEDDLALANLIISKCKPFLTQGRYEPIFRGETFRSFTFDRKLPILDFDGNKFMIPIVDVKHPEADRSPRDTSGALHKFFDQKMKEKFGWGGRSQGLFVTGSVAQALAYHDAGLYMVFPVGEFKYIWSKHEQDLYNSLRQHDIEKNGVKYGYHDFKYKVD